MRRALAAFALAFAGACLRPPPPASPPAAPPPLRVPDGCLLDLSGAWVHGDDSSYVYVARDDGTALTLTARREFPVDAGFRPRRFGRADAGGLPRAAAPAPGGAAATGPADAGAGPIAAPDAGRAATAAAPNGGVSGGSAAAPDGGVPGGSAATPDGGGPGGSGTDGGAAGLRATAGGGPDAAAPNAGARVGADAGGGLSSGVTALVVLERTPHGFVGVTTALTQHPTGRLCEARFATEVLACGDAGLVIATESATALGDACQPPANPRAAARLEHRLIRRPAPPP